MHTCVEQSCVAPPLALIYIYIKKRTTRGTTTVERKLEICGLAAQNVQDLPLQSRAVVGNDQYIIFKPTVHVDT